MSGRSHPAAAFRFRVTADSERSRNVFLIGPMGSGKTAVGRQLARSLGLEFVDSDAEIEPRTGVDIAYIFEREGEAGFRQRERDVIDALTRARWPSCSRRAAARSSIRRTASGCASAASSCIFGLQSSSNSSARAATPPAAAQQSRPARTLARLMANARPLYR